jgi:hypothetical protein
MPSHTPLKKIKGLSLFKTFALFLQNPGPSPWLFSRTDDYENLTPVNRKFKELWLPEAEENILSCCFFKSITRKMLFKGIPYIHH